jgi:hypothetical protein
MFSNCIKYNNSCTNIYRIEAIRQRKLFVKLYQKATIEFEMSMGYSEQSNSSSSAKKTTKSNKTKVNLTSLHASKASDSLSKKRKHGSIHSTPIKISRKRISTGPRCQLIGTAGTIKASSTSPIKIGCDAITQMVLGRPKVRLQLEFRSAASQRSPNFLICRDL